MKLSQVLQVTTIAMTLASPAIALQDTSSTRALSILCRPDSLSLWEIHPLERISVSWIDCAIRSHDTLLYERIETIMRWHKKYKNAFVLVLGREMKAPPNSSMNASPYTANFILKIDFDHTDGTSSTTIFYTYNEKQWLTETSNSNATARLKGK